MPKIIENIRERLLEEAKCQVMEKGYSSMTIRSVAKACGVSVGTVYNYFPSKDMLVAGFMLEDWQQCMERIVVFCRTGEGAGKYIKEEDCIKFDNECLHSRSSEAVLQCVYEVLSVFISKYTALFKDESAVANFAAVFPKRHEQLRSQIAEPLKEVCRRQSRADADFLAVFIAENMLIWTLAGRSFEEISSIILQLL